MPECLGAWVPAPTLPNRVSIKALCDSFSCHFKNKISLNRSVFPDDTLKHVQVDGPQENSLLISFTSASLNKVRKIMMSSPNKSCDLDPLPTALLKACLDTLLYQITNNYRKYVCSGLYRGDFRPAQINALLKKSILPKENLSSHRPISNISLISKVLENFVTSRLWSHIESNHMSNI